MHQFCRTEAIFAMHNPQNGKNHHMMNNYTTILPPNNTNSISTTVQLIINKLQRIGRLGLEHHCKVVITDFARMQSFPNSVEGLDVQVSSKCIYIKWSIMLNDGGAGSTSFVDMVAFIYYVVFKGGRRVVRPQIGTNIKRHITLPTKKLMPEKMESFWLPWTLSSYKLGIFLPHTLKNINYKLFGLSVVGAIYNWGITIKIANLIWCLSLC